MRKPNYRSLGISLIALLFYSNLPAQSYQSCPPKINAIIKVTPADYVKEDYAIYAGENAQLTIGHNNLVESIGFLDGGHKGKSRSTGWVHLESGNKVTDWLVAANVILGNKNVLDKVVSGNVGTTGCGNAIDKMAPVQPSGVQPPSAFLLEFVSRKVCEICGGSDAFFDGNVLPSPTTMNTVLHDEVKLVNGIKVEVDQPLYIFCKLIIKDLSKIIAAATGTGDCPPLIAVCELEVEQGGAESVAIMGEVINLDGADINGPLFLVGNNPIAHIQNSVLSGGGLGSEICPPTAIFPGGQKTGLPESQEVSSLRSFSVFPNPASSSLNVEFSTAQAGPVTLELWNTMGQKLDILFQGTVERGVVNRIRYDAGHLNAGVYLAKLREDNGSTSHVKILLSR